MRALFLIALMMLLVLEAAPLDAQEPSVSADEGGVAIGGDVRDSEITIGVPLGQVDELVRERIRPLEALTESQRDTIGLLKQNLELTQGQVRAALEIVGEKDVPSEKLAAKLIAIAQQFRELRATAAAEPGDDAEIAALKTQAQEAIDAGDLSRADELLVEILTKQLAQRDRLASNAATTLARRGEVALAGLEYVNAAEHFAGAAHTLPLGEEYSDRRFDYLQREANALFRQGDEFGQNEHLLGAVDRYQDVLQIVVRARMPPEWAATQNDLGFALLRLGEREGGAARLEEAVTAFRAALVERTRERVPLDWADTQNNLGLALQILGERASGTARLEEAVAAHRAALEERTRTQAPIGWGHTQNNLGIALMRLGERESGTVRLNEAAEAYREALKELTRARVPLDWAQVQSNLGIALWQLGERERSTVRLEEAVTAYRAALEERTRVRVPLGWAQTQNNLGIVLMRLGQARFRLGDDERGMARLEDGVAAFRSALEERIRERVPLDWAMTQYDLGSALQTLGERESGTARLEEAVVAYRASLEERTRESAPLQWARAQHNLAIVLLVLFDRTSNRPFVNGALEAVNDASEEFRKAKAAYEIDKAERLRAEVLRRMR